MHATATRTSDERTTETGKIEMGSPNYEKAWEIRHSFAQNQATQDTDRPGLCYDTNLSLSRCDTINAGVGSAGHDDCCGEQKNETDGVPLRLVNDILSFQGLRLMRAWHNKGGGVGRQGGERPVLVILQSENSSRTTILCSNVVSHLMDKSSYPFLWPKYRNPSNGFSIW